MRRKLKIGLVLAAAAAALITTTSAEAEPRHRDDGLAKAFAGTTRATVWTQVAKIPLKYETHHPQGFAVVGDRIFMSTVEILEAPVRYPEPIGGYDRSPGKGVGHVLVLDRTGRLISDITLGEGTMYHPGGIDYDGRSLWVPVAEYRPNSRGVVYRINPQSLRVREAFRVGDHVGGVVRDQATGVVHGVSWGSRTLYSWTVDGRQLTRQANRSHFVDYQDCAYVAWRKQICSGIAGLPRPGGGSYELGGLALLDLRDNRILHEVPVPLFSTAGHVVTRNPVALELEGDTLRMLAAPDDGNEGNGTELLVYEARVAPRP